MMLPLSICKKHNPVRNESQVEISELISLDHGMTPVLIEGMHRIKQLPTELALYLLAGGFEIESVRELDQILTESQWTPPHFEDGVSV